MYNPNTIPYLNREIRRKVEKYRRRHPKLTFTQAYNQLFDTSYDEPLIYGSDTSVPSDNARIIDVKTDTKDLTGSV